MIQGRKWRRVQKGKNRSTRTYRPAGGGEIGQNSIKEKEKLLISGAEKAEQNRSKYRGRRNLREKNKKRRRRKRKGKEFHLTKKRMSRRKRSRTADHRREKAEPIMAQDRGHQLPEKKPARKRSGEMNPVNKWIKSPSSDNGA